MENKKKIENKSIKKYYLGKRDTTADLVGVLFIGLVLGVIFGFFLFSYSEPNREPNPEPIIKEFEIDYMRIKYGDDVFILEDLEISYDKTKLGNLIVDIEKTFLDEGFLIAENEIRKNG